MSCLEENLNQFSFVIIDGAGPSDAGQLYMQKI